MMWQRCPSVADEPLEDGMGTSVVGVEPVVEGPTSSVVTVEPLEDGMCASSSDELFDVTVLKNLKSETTSG